MTALKSLSSKPVIFVLWCLHPLMARFHSEMSCFHTPGKLQLKPGDLHVMSRLWVWLKPSTWLQQKGGALSCSPSLCWAILMSAGQGREFSGHMVFNKLQRNDLIISVGVENPDSSHASWDTFPVLLLRQDRSLWPCGHYSHYQARH